MALRNIIVSADGADENTMVRLVKSSTFSYEQAWHRYRKCNQLHFHLTIWFWLVILHDEFPIKKGLVGDWFLQFQFLDLNVIACLTPDIFTIPAGLH